MGEGPNADLIRAAEELVSAELRRLEDGYLRVFRGIVDSLQQYESQFPDGVPGELVAGDVKTFAEHLGEACDGAFARVIAAAVDTDGRNVLTVCESFYDDAANYSHLIRRDLIRGCDAIHQRGVAECLARYPQLANVKDYDVPWMVVLGRLRDASYAALESTLAGAASREKRATAPVAVFCARVDDSVWSRTSLFSRYFLPFLRKQLAEPGMGGTWRESESLRSQVDADFVRSVCGADIAAPRLQDAEDSAFAFLVFKLKSYKEQEELQRELTETLADRFSYAGHDSELDELCRGYVANSVNSAFDALRDEALALTRESFARSGLGGG